MATVELYSDGAGLQPRYQSRWELSICFYCRWRHRDCGFAFLENAEGTVERRGQSALHQVSDLNYRFWSYFNGNSRATSRRSTTQEGAKETIAVAIFHPEAPLVPGAGLGDFPADP